MKNIDLKTFKAKSIVGKIWMLTLIKTHKCDLKWKK